MHSAVPHTADSPGKRSGWRGTCIALALASCAALLSACGARYEAPLTVGTNTWTGYEPLYLARDLGLHEGLPLRLVELGSTTQSMDGLRTGRLDMAGLTLDEALTLVQEGIPIKVIWVVDISQGADALVARYGVAGLADLRGRKVGVEQTAVGAYMLNAALAKAGLRTTDITVVPLPLDEHLTAWRESQVDALVTFDPVLQVLRGKARRCCLTAAPSPVKSWTCWWRAPTRWPVAPSASPNCWPPTNAPWPTWVPRGRTLCGAWRPAWASPPQRWTRP